MRNLDHLEICRMDKTAKHKQPRKFLECVDDNLLLKEMEETMKRGSMQDLILTKRTGRNAKPKGSLSCNDHEMVEFNILRAAMTACNKLSSLVFSCSSLGVCFMEFHEIEP